jgi:hypothetical protein
MGLKSVVILSFIPFYALTSWATVINRGARSYITPGDPEMVYLARLLNPAVIPVASGQGAGASAAVASSSASSESCDPYAGSHKILSLGDGFAQNINAIGALLAALYPDKELVASDLDCPEEVQKGNLTLKKADHRQKLPFESGQFDRIVMKKGICTCMGAVTCGGIREETAEHSDMKNFLQEVVRILNTKSPDAVALLDGPSSIYDPLNKAAILENWEKILNGLAQTYPKLEFQMLYVGKPEVLRRYKEVVANGNEKELAMMEGLLEGKKKDNFGLMYVFAGIRVRVKK